MAERGLSRKQVERKNRCVSSNLTGSSNFLFYNDNFNLKRKEKDNLIMLTIEKARYYNGLSDTMKYKAYLKEALKVAKEEEIIRADEICDIMAHLISEYKGIPCAGLKEHYDQWFEILVTAAYLYSSYFEENYRYLSIVKPREDTEHIAKEVGLTPVETEYIFQAVESTQGFYGPQKWKTAADTPSEMLVLAIYLYNNWDNLKKHLN